MDEFLYAPTATSRFTRTTGVPAILLTTLPHLTAQPEAPVDELREFVVTLEPRRAIGQYRRVFERLERRFARKVWAANRCSGSRLSGSP